MGEFVSPRCQQSPGSRKAPPQLIQRAIPFLSHQLKLQSKLAPLPRKGAELCVHFRLGCRICTADAAPKLALLPRQHPKLFLQFDSILLLQAHCLPQMVRRLCIAPMTIANRATMRSRWMIPPRAPLIIPTSHSTNKTATSVQSILFSSPLRLLLDRFVFLPMSPKCHTRPPVVQAGLFARLSLSERVTARVLDSLLAGPANRARPREPGDFSELRRGPRHRTRSGARASARQVDRVI